MRHRVMIAFLTLAFCLCIFPTNGGADVWTYLDSDKTGKWYYDKGSLTATGSGTVVFWVKVLYAKDALKELIAEEKTKGTYRKSHDSWNYSMFNYACECDKETCGLQSSIAYSVKGTVVHTYSAAPITEKWENLGSEPILNKLVNDICKKETVNPVSGRTFRAD